MEAEQMELDFGETDPKLKEKEYKHFECPKNDNEQLLEYQYQFKKGDKKALDLMYFLGKEICIKYIKTEAKRNKHIARLAEELQEEKAHNAITYIITRYINIPSFGIDSSFTGYLYLRIKHELYYRTKTDSLVMFCNDEEMTNYIDNGR